MIKRLTTTEVAERLGVGKSTVNLWCNQGHFPNAQSESTPRGPVWMIPESDLTVFVQPTPGRPPGKVSTANKAATAKPTANGGASVKKKGKR
jgi:excisionase family DNA binding protein